MIQDQFTPGVLVVHIKMQILGKVIKIADGLVHVKISENKPLQVWPKEELSVWNARDEIQKKLMQGGYIRDIFKKMDNL